MLIYMNLSNEYVLFRINLRNESKEQKKRLERGVGNILVAFMLFVVLCFFFFALNMKEAKRRMRQEE